MITDLEFVFVLQDFSFLKADAYMLGLIMGFSHNWQHSLKIVERIRYTTVKIINVFVKRILYMTLMANA